MATDDEIFNSDTKESDNDDILNKATKSAPHKLNLQYCLNLKPDIVRRFPREPIIKSTEETLTLARSGMADICLFDTEFSREGLTISFATTASGDVMCNVKNLSKIKSIELKSPNGNIVNLKFNDKSNIVSHTQLTVSILTLIVVMEIGDVDSLLYEVTMTGYDTEVFNRMIINGQGNRIPVSEVHPQHDYSSYHQTTPKQINIGPYDQFSSRTSHFNPCPTQQNNLDTCLQNSTPRSYDQNIPCSCCSGGQDLKYVLNNDNHRCSPQTPDSLQFSFDECRRNRRCVNFDRSTPNSCCNAPIVHTHSSRLMQETGSPSYKPISPPEAQSLLGHVACRCAEQPNHGNWHSYSPNHDLPVAPPLRQYSIPCVINTHSYPENTPHDFNPNIADSYLEKPDKCSG